MMTRVPKTTEPKTTEPKTTEPKTTEPETTEPETTALEGPDWREVNRANWDERVPIHLASEAYDLGPLRAGNARLHPIEQAEVGAVEGLRILHLQCHFGRDSLILAQQGATVVGLDFSGPAVETATALAAELGLSARARFIQSDLYAAREAIPEPASFDRVFVTWGAIGWLPDIKGWAAIVAHFLKPGGRLYMAESHPAAQVFDDLVAEADGRPGWFVPYFADEPLDLDDPSDYADGEAQLTNSRTFWWIHTLGDVVTALIAAGLTLRWLHEHDAVPWRMFKRLVEADGGMYRWPDKPWLPMAFSLEAERPG